MSNIYLNQEMSKEEVARRTSEAFKRLGTRLLISESDSTQRSFTSTTYVDYNQFVKSFTTSGGLIEVDIVLRMFVPSGQVANARLLIDDKQEDECISLGQDTDSNDLKYKKNLPAGRHTAKVQCKIDGGTLNLNDDGSTGTSTSKFFVKETLGG